MPNTGPVRQPPKLGSLKAASQVAATTLARRTKLRTRSGTIRLHKESESYHKFRDAVARVISQEFAPPSTREVLELNFSLETHPLLLRAAIQSGVSGIVWPDRLAIWVTHRDNIVTGSYPEPSMVEHGVTYAATLVPEPQLTSPSSEGLGSFFARLFSPSRA